MRIRSIFLLALGLVGVHPSLQGLEQVRFNVDGDNPYGQGKYAGHVVIKEVSTNTATVQWTIGMAKEVTEGVAIKTNSAVGTAYSGKPLTLLSILEIKDDGIQVLWTRPAKLAETGTFKLAGADFAGKMAIAGESGHVTFSEEAPSVYKVNWELSDGNHEGIGIRQGNVLVVASGDIADGIGVGLLTPKEEKFEGVWVTTRSDKPGTEVWTNVRPLLGRELVFGGEPYLLRENQSAPGKGTSQLREYLREGDSWKGYSKMVALRLQHADGDAQKLARAALEDVKKEHPDAVAKEVETGPEGTTLMFVLSKDKDVEFNLWHYKDMEHGIASVQFVLRNKPPFADQEAFVAEQDRNLDHWLKDVKSLAKNAGILIEDSVGMTVAEEKDNASTDGELSAALKAELDKCAETAKQFVRHLQSQETDKAVALMSDAAFTNTNRQDFALKITESNKAFGKMKAFNVDKNRTSFTNSGGVMTFIIEADVEYENAMVREAIRFVRNEKNADGFRLVGYSRRMKK